jgi:hypothetical protein
MEELDMFKRKIAPLANKILLGIGLMVLGIVQGCSMVPTKTLAPLPSTDTVGNSSLIAGRKIYVSLLKCAMCHRPKSVSDYSAQIWADDILPRMSKKAKLSPQQYADVLAYVTSTTTHE